MESRTENYIAATGQAKRGFDARRTRFVVFAALLTLLAGCRPGYVTKVGIEHLRFMSRAVPIPEAIEETDDPEKKKLLALVLDVREFAKAQGLDVGGSYAKVSDTSGLVRAWVVTAAHKDRLEPYEWRYPVVGRIPYRGYFDVAKAEEYSAKLAGELDTYVVEASGYSTLGWFDDPLPSGLLDAGEVGLASTVIHELVHQTLFVPDAIAFNETLASAVESRLAVTFFEKRGEDEAAGTAHRRRERWLEQCAYSDGLAAELESLFERREDLPRGKLLAERAVIYESAKPRMKELGMLRDPPEGVSRDLNNALFLALYRYRTHCKAIDEFLGTFDDVRSALDELEVRLAETDDPYAAVSR